MNLSEGVYVHGGQKRIKYFNIITRYLSELSHLAYNRLTEVLGKVQNNTARLSLAQRLRVLVLGGSSFFFFRILID